MGKQLRESLFPIIRNLVQEIHYIGIILQP